MFRKLISEYGSSSRLTNLLQGETALHKAAADGSLQSVQSLLLHKSDPHMPNKLGAGPLHSACNNGTGPVVQLLLDSHADPETPNSVVIPCHSPVSTQSALAVALSVCCGFSVNLLASARV